MAYKYEIDETDLVLYTEIPEDIQKEMRVSGNKMGVLRAYHVYLVDQLYAVMKAHQKHYDKIAANTGYKVKDPLPSKEFLATYWYDWETFLFAVFACHIYCPEESKDGETIFMASKYSIQLMREYITKVYAWDFKAYDGEWPKITNE